MKKLKKKTFMVIFLIFISFLLIFIVFTNIQNYNREYNNLRNNLLRINNIFFKDGKPNDFENRIIMDYEIYTITFDSNNNVVNIFTYSNETTNFDVESIASNILRTESKGTFKINNLYFNNYIYRLDNDSLTIINTKMIQERLTRDLLYSLILFTVMELIVLVITHIITNYLTKPAEESFNKQKEFIANASHELKTPLAVIIASSDALEKDNNPKWLNNIKDETEKMNKLITNLLDLSKLENGINIENYKEENLSKIVEKESLTFESIAYEKDVFLDTVVDENIKFKCNVFEINELLSILIDNAIKHSEKKSHIKISLQENKSNILLKVVNKGDEIKKEECEKIFERFYRLDKSRNRSEGRYGLGLAIAKNIVLNHNGKIRAYSDNGFTTFEVNFKK